MTILKNAWLSITRNKGRNVQIGIIIMVIAIGTSVALAIRNSAKSLIDSYEDQYEIEATIGVNRDTMKENMKDMAPPSTDSSSGSTSTERSEKMDDMRSAFSEASNLTVDEINSYGDSDYVKSYYYSLSVGLDSSSLTKASSSSSSTTNAGGNSNSKGMTGGPGTETSTTDFTLVGYSSISAMSDFVSGNYTITDGSVSDDLTSNTCVINEELATLNNLSVGDTITLYDSDSTTNTITLTITGIFSENDSSESSSSGMSMFTSSANTIITNTNVINTLTNKDSSLKVTTTPTFILTSKDDIDAFTSEVESKGLSSYLTVSTNLDQIESSTETISNVSGFALTFLIVILIIGGIVLFVINMINIRERKYEIGVLRTIGMKKSTLTLQFICELSIVSIVALIVGAIIGASVSIPVSNALLANEISSQSNKTSEVASNFGMDKQNGNFDHVNGVANTQAFDSINAVVDIKVLAELLLIGLLLTIISSIAALVSIQRFSPLTILKERS